MEKEFKNPPDVTWSIEDEIKLLDAIIHYGYGNWLSISKQVPPYSPQECEHYYINNFVPNKVKRGPPLCSNNCKILIDPATQRNLNNADISDMNDYITNYERKEETDVLSKQQSSSDVSANQKIWNYMVALPPIGYNRVRSDFDIEYDNNAENILALIGENHIDPSDMDEEEANLFHEMEFALYQSFNERLNQRNYCKKVVRDHCLIDRRKTFNTLQRLDIAFGNTTLKSLIPIMRFQNGPEFDFLVEKLKYQIDLKLKIALMMEYRSFGIRHLGDIDIYKRLNNQRLGYRGELAELSMASEETRSNSFYQKKPTAPLVLAHLPGYNQLTEEERKLCSTSRLVPETYLGFKEALISECEKHNGLRLAQARNLIKIDVNKTRKIYDYLVSLNMIWTPYD